MLTAGMVFRLQRNGIEYLWRLKGGIFRCRICRNRDYPYYQQRWQAKKKRNSFIPFPFFVGQNRKFETVADGEIRVGRAGETARRPKRPATNRSKQPAPTYFTNNQEKKCLQIFWMSAEKVESVKRNDSKPSVLISSLGPLPFWLLGFLFLVWMPSLRIASGLSCNH